MDVTAATLNELDKTHVQQLTAARMVEPRVAEADGSKTYDETIDHLERHLTPMHTIELGLDTFGRRHRRCQWPTDFSGPDVV